MNALIAEWLQRERSLIEDLRVVVEHYTGQAKPASAEVDPLTFLTSALRERIRNEETQLLPELERRLAHFEPGPHLRRQHAVLLELVDGVERALGEGQLSAAAGDLRELRAALRAHLEEERRLLQPFASPS